MRNYGSKAVRERIVRPRAEAVCPFPGKHPLRLSWHVRSKNINVSYFGKFTTASWKLFVVSSNDAYAHDAFSATRFSLFDRNGELTSGSIFDMRPMSAIHKMRYFPYVSGRLRDSLHTAERRACGPYWVYTTEPLTDTETATAIRNIETTIPTLRNR